MANDVSRRSRSFSGSTAARLDDAAGFVDLAADAYLTEFQFCDRCHVSPRTAQRWRSNGQGPLWIRMGPIKVAYRLSDVERWASARTFRHRADELSRGAQ